MRVSISALSLRQFGKYLCLCAGVLYLVVGLGQVVQLARIVDGVERIQLWPRLLANATLVLSEVVFPLSALFTAILVFGRWRSDGTSLGLFASGQRPSRLVLPVTLVACAGAVLLVASAHFMVPRAVQEIGNIVKKATGQSLLLDRFETGQIRILRPPSETGRDVLWAAVDGGEEPATLIRVDGLGFDEEREQTVSSGQLHLWGPDVSVEVQRAYLALDTEQVAKRLRMFGPPNALVSPELDVSQAHHAFTFHRRSSVPIMIVPWTLIGAVLGLSFGGVFATLFGVGMVGTGYWLLRTGELAARRGDLDPALAAWAPLVVTVFCAALFILVLERRGPRGHSVEP